MTRAIVILQGMHQLRTRTRLPNDRFSRAADLHLPDFRQSLRRRAGRSHIIKRLPHDKVATHVATSLVDRKAAVICERTGLVGAELERHAPIGRRTLRDAIFVDREAVGDVLRDQRDADDVVLIHLESFGPERVSTSCNGELPHGSRLFASL
jgi:hypothetical protein